MARRRPDDRNALEDDQLYALSGLEFNEHSAEQLSERASCTGIMALAVALWAVIFFSIFQAARWLLN